MTLVTYTIRRLIIIVPTFFLISILLFTLIHLAPGDPISIMVASNPMRLNQTQIDNLKKEYGLDQPVFVQYLVWVGRLFRGDLGYSYTYAEPVIELVGIKVPRTLELMIMVQVLSLILAIFWVLFLLLSNTR